MAQDNFPTFIVVEKRIMWMAAFLRFRKDWLGREYRELGVVPVDEERALLQWARDVERPNMVINGFNVIIPDPIPGKLYPIPNGVSLENFHPRWNKLD